MKAHKDMPTAEQKRLRDMYTIMTAIRDLGPLREPEVAARTGLDEDRVYRVSKHLVERGYLARRACDGELSFP